MRRILHGLVALVGFALAMNPASAGEDAMSPRDRANALREAIEQGRQALLARPRMDMPGAVAMPQQRDFGRTF